MAFLRPFICYLVFLDHLDLQVVEFNMFNEIILIKAGLIMLFEIPHCGIQPDRISQIHLITDLLKSVKDLVGSGIIAVITDNGVLKHAIVFPYFSP